MILELEILVAVLYLALVFWLVINAAKEHLEDLEEEVVIDSHLEIGDAPESSSEPQYSSVSSVKSQGGRRS